MANQLEFEDIISVFQLFSLPFVIESFHDRIKDDLVQHPPFTDVDT